MGLFNWMKNNKRGHDLMAAMESGDEDRTAQLAGGFIVDTLRTATFSDDQRAWIKTVLDDREVARAFMEELISAFLLRVGTKPDWAHAAGRETIVEHVCSLYDNRFFLRGMLNLPPK